jgi:hypothetical protein
MSELRKRMIECLQLRGLAERTQEAYTRAYANWPHIIISRLTAPLASLHRATLILNTLGGPL